MQDFFNAVLAIIGFLFSNDIMLFDTVPLWSILVGSSIFIALIKFLKGKGSGS